VPLTIVTNQQAFESTELNEREGHLGTRDRFDPTRRYDFPGKALGCLEAARALEQLTMPSTQDGLFGTLRDGNRQPLARITITSSSREPTNEQLLKGHDAEYVTNLKETSERARIRAAQNEDVFISDFGKEADVTPGTFGAARSAVGASFDMIDTILRSEEDTGFALVWPPGHHAERDLAMGFCYLSNAALAALYARDHDLQMRPGFRNRIVVIDIDHHRGNGTACILANEADTLFVDVSYRSPYDVERKRFTDGQYDPVKDRYLDAGREYPYSKYDHDHGLAAHPATSAPNILSVEFEGIQEDHRLILSRFLHEIVPHIVAFGPDVVLWSVGLDSALGDPLGGLGNLPSSFYTFIRGMRLALPEARHGALLEGGYEEQRWFTCLPPTLLALHDDPRDDKNRCRTFRNYRNAFADAADAGQP
jgi:acetoin utilization deacetylase AcuC-like enzyme